MITLYFMVEGIGIDSIEKTRIAKAVSRWGDRFLEKIFTERELQNCQGKPDRTGSLAARFAAKEAVFKALGTGWREGLGWKDIETVTQPGGKPEVIFHRKACDGVRGKKVHLSLSHDSQTALAFVIIESPRGA